MIQLYQNINTLKVLSSFFNDPYSSYYLREIARELSMSPMTVKRSLDLLLKDSIIVRYEEKNLILYRLNVEDPSTRYMKISFNISRFIASGYLKENIDEGLHSIIIYGSYAKGTDSPESDIDVLMISSLKNGRNPKTMSVDGREISTIRMTPNQWKEQSKVNRPFYLEILKDGIPIYGKIPVME